uniref:Dipeptidyl peptidase 3 n=1 Tax=Callorhinchus milii TaxID=7868 RepID=A0A4W3GLX6_CALMI
MLSKEEKLYAHYLSQAAWYGGLVVLLQTSPESPTIYVLLQKLFAAQPLSELQATATEVGLTADEHQAFLVYAAGIYSNMGNYKSFGDTKFIPNLPKEKLKELVWHSTAHQRDPQEVERLWEACGDPMFSLHDRQKQLGLGDKGITTYFSGNCDLKDAELAQRFLDSKNISAYNTRMFKTTGKNGKCTYEIRLASVLKDGTRLNTCCDLTSSHPQIPLLSLSPPPSVPPSHSCPLNTHTHTHPHTPARLSGTRLLVDWGGESLPNKGLSLHDCLWGRRWAPRFVPRKRAVSTLYGIFCEALWHVSTT